MTFQESVKACLAKYADFNGTATRSEYWWFILFGVIVNVVLSILGQVPYLGWLFALANVVFLLGILIPTISAATRRLHDTGRSGWWQLICLVPLVGWIILLVFLAQEGKTGSAFAPTRAIE
jgi:uncharacterized membrane protein YhaH (DUF805 family)